MKRHKIISIFVAFSLAFSNVVTLPAINQVSAITNNINGEEVKVYKDYKYTVLEDNTIKILKYTGKDSNVDIPSSINDLKVSILGENSFYGNDKIKTINIPEGISEIQDYAFNCNFNLKEVNMPSSLKKVGKAGFYSCTRLEKVNFPEGLESLGDGAFYDCESLSEIELPNSLRDVGEYVFARCKSLQKVTIKDGISYLSNLMFMECARLSEVNLPNKTLKKINRKVFLDCMELNNISIPESVEYIGEDAFSGCCNINSLKINAKTIEKNAFYMCSSLENLVLTDNVETIKDQAFYSSAIINVTIPKNVSEIGEGAFNNYSMEYFDVSPENKSFSSADGVLFNKDKTELISYTKTEMKEKYEIPEGTVKIASYAFYSKGNFNEIIIPSSVKEIGKKAFYNCSNLTQIIIPESVSYIGQGAFSGCYELSLVSISGDNLEIDSEAFNECMISSLVLNDGVVKIDDYAFDNVELEEVTLSKDTSYVSPLAFNGCKKINVPSDNNYFTSIDGVLFSKDKSEIKLFPLERNNDETYTIPSGTTKIGEKAFINANKVKKINIPEGVKSIGNMAFCNCNVLSEISIPSSVEEISSNAFGYNYDSQNNSFLSLSQRIIYGNLGSEAEKYATNNDILFLQDEAKANATEINLKAQEEFDFSISNIPKDKIVFTSSNTNIAEVTKDGKIIGKSQGTTKIYASIATYDFICNVNVTSGSSDVLHKDNEFKEITEDIKDEWKKAYYKLNSKMSFKPIDNPSIFCYTGSEYVGIMAASVGGKYTSQAKDMYGEDIKHYGVIKDNLNYELGKYKLDDNIVLYSGTSDVEDIIGEKSTILNMKNSIGKTYVSEGVISTSIDHHVTRSYGSGSEKTVLEIYAPKNITKGAFIENISQYPQETEFLLAGNIKYEIMDAGVREVDFGYGEIISERFLKLKIVENKEAEKEDPKKPQNNKDNNNPDSNTKKDDSNADSSVNTGDSNNTLWYLVISLSISELFVIYYVRKREKN